MKRNASFVSSLPLLMPLLFAACVLSLLSGLVSSTPHPTSPRVYFALCVWGAQGTAGSTHLVDNSRRCCVCCLAERGTACAPEPRGKAEDLVLARARLY